MATLIIFLAFSWEPCARVRVILVSQAWHRVSVFCFFPDKVRVMLDAPPWSLYSFRNIDDLAVSCPNPLAIYFVRDKVGKDDDFGGLINFMLDPYLVLIPRM